MTARLAIILALLLAGCADTRDDGAPGSVRMHMNGSYTAFGGFVSH
jgi:hypothetical protein